MPRIRCPAVPLCAYADPLIRELKRLVPRALEEWDEKSIHEARVATRRLRAAAGLVEPLADAELLAPLLKALKRLRRRLGPLRDLDVMLGHLRPLLGRPRHAEAARWLSDRIRSARNAARRKVRKNEDPARWRQKLDAWEPVRQRIVQLGDEVEATMLASLPRQWDAFAAHAGRLATHLLDAPEQDIHDPHELRIAGKLLRYTLEMAAAAGHRPPALVTRSFKRMQGELGLWHDHVVLAERAMRESLDAQLAHHDPDLQARVLDLVRASLLASQRHLKRFARLWRDRGPAMGEAVGQLGGGGGGGGGGGVSEPRTDRDRFGSATPQAAEGAPPVEPSAA
ncbi:MAG TPA: CHAD domain-containing protein [Tepidisphaeraceae bacterium]|nr:CHAD domain-containing protein [Tepidisphaeraceae bacterium]